jgi:GNAT superfamily N-acetyltransferase
LSFRLDTPVNDKEYRVAVRLLWTQIGDPSLVLPPPTLAYLRTETGDMFIVARNSNNDIIGAAWASRPYQEIALSRQYGATAAIPVLERWIMFHGIAVEPEFRGRSIGTALANEIATKARHQNSERIIGVISAHKPIAKFYQQLGARLLAPGQNLKVAIPEQPADDLLPIAATHRWVYVTL